ncbi:MAG: DUF4367 domain-containing protein [Oliverpabstia sp.]|nr:DUF4367 domain-containing protein [Oliverpabstia sp.]
MSKSVKIQDSPEFKAFKENFEATMDAMEKDPEFAQMKLPEEWERDFKETMEATWEEERQRKKKRIGKRIAIAAGVTLVTLAGLNLGVQQVQGEGLVEFFQKTFHLNGKQYTTFDAGKEFEMDEENESADIYFEASTLSEVNEQVREKFGLPMFGFQYFPEGYDVDNAQYNKTYNMLNVDLQNSNEVIYVFQQQQFDMLNSGVVNDTETYTEVYNKNLNQKIVIYHCTQDDFLSFSIMYEHTFLVVRCNISLEECEKIAKGIYYS